MANPKNFISETAAGETLGRFFASTTSDEISLEGIYEAAGRAHIDEHTNRNWLNTKMNQLKHHNLITTVQTFDKDSKRHKLTGIRLTLAGKRAIGRVGADYTEPVHRLPSAAAVNTSIALNELTVDQILMAVPLINERLAAFKLKVTLEDKEPVV
jgi:hypothetical protein